MRSLTRVRIKKEETPPTNEQENLEQNAQEEQSEQVTPEKQEQTMELRHKEVVTNQNYAQDQINPEKIGRNDPCPCGSGKKYKKCHGAHLN